MSAYTPPPKHTFEPLENGLQCSKCFLFEKAGCHSKLCKECDYENAIRVGRANWRCPKCNRDLTLELVLMHEAGITIKSPNQDEEHKENL